MSDGVHPSGQGQPAASGPDAVLNVDNDDGPDVRAAVEPPDGFDVAESQEFDAFDLQDALSDLMEEDGLELFETFEGSGLCAFLGLRSAFSGLDLGSLGFGHRLRFL
jgi:hypothetical protein